MCVFCDIKISDAINTTTGTTQYYIIIFYVWSINRSLSIVANRKNAIDMQKWCKIYIANTHKWQTHSNLTAQWNIWWNVIGAIDWCLHSNWTEEEKKKSIW